MTPDPSDASPFAASNPQASWAASSDFDQRFAEAIDSPQLAPTQPAFVNASASTGDAIRAVERSLASDIGGESSGADSAGGSPGNTQEPAALLTETNQQLELIRQTLEKILAKPGSVVLD
jgi:hypothetical protein